MPMTPLFKINGVNRIKKNDSPEEDTLKSFVRKASRIALYATLAGAALTFSILEIKKN